MAETVEAVYSSLNKTGQFPVTVAGIPHFAEVLSVLDSGRPFRFRIFRNENDTDWSSIFVKSGPTLRRPASDFAATILKWTGEPKGAQLVVDAEQVLERPFSVKTFNVLAGVINAHCRSTHVRLGCRLSHDAQKIEIKLAGLKPFLSIGKNETDREILGRVLCGVLLAPAKNANGRGDR